MPIFENDLKDIHPFFLCLNPPQLQEKVPSEPQTRAAKQI
jgi:hypothetical protein